MLPTGNCRWIIALSAAMSVLAVTLFAPFQTVSAQGNPGSCATGGAVADAAKNPGLVSDCEALLAGRDTLAGSATLNWSASAPISEWEGVTLGGSPLRVTGLSLDSKGLSGEIPPELGSLSNLSQLFLARNQLTGPIPAELGNLEFLYTTLGGNQLTGCIPDALGNFEIVEVSLPFCGALLDGLTSEPGPLTPSFDTYRTNYLISKVPSRITVALPANLSFYLVYVDDRDNTVPDADPAIEGHQIDFDVGMSIIRIEVVAKDGRTTSTYRIAAQRVEPCTNGGAVSDPAFNPLLVSDCNALLAARDTLAGSAALNWSADTSIYEWEGVYLEGNPPRVAGLNLREKGLTGQIPAALGRLTSLRHLDLPANRLTGSIPVELANLSNLESLTLWENQLSGTIPPWLGALTRLNVLTLGNNRFTGTIPPELGNIANLHVLWLNQNRLTGGIPHELGFLRTLRSLWLHENQLTGEIPTSFGSLDNLEQLNLAHNQFSGCIPGACATRRKITCAG